LLSRSGALLHRARLSFPTRCSSDLLILGDLPDAEGLAFAGGRVPQDERLGLLDVEVLGRVEGDRGGELVGGPSVVGPTVRVGHRSEEHTSELQSRENLVCRLLLEKK